MDKHQLCHNRNEDKPWSSVFRSEKPCDIGRCVWKQTEEPGHIPHTQWMNLKIAQSIRTTRCTVYTHLVNVCTCIKCEKVFSEIETLFIVHKQN